jgi:hypothetical protein
MKSDMASLKLYHYPLLAGLDMLLVASALAAPRLTPRAARRILMALLTSFHMLLVASAAGSAVLVR